MIKWMMIAVFATSLGCTSDPSNNGGDKQASCERTEIDGTEYCTYEQPITETGYDCPPDLSNPIPFEGHTVCSSRTEIPQEHHDPLREHIDQSSTQPDAGTGDSLIAALCANPAQYHGQSITVPGESLRTPGYGHTIQCPYPDTGTDAGRTCCNSLEGVFVIRCPQGSQSRIILNPGPNAGADFWCSGDNCGMICDPAQPSDIASVTGIFHSDDAPYNSVHDGFGPDGDWSHGSFSAELEVSNFVLADE